MNKILLLLFNITLGLGLIVYTIYRRILVIRLPKDLYVVDFNSIKFGLISLILISIICCSIIIIRNSLQLLGQQENTKSSFNRLSISLNMIIDNALFQIYNCTELFISDSYNKASCLLQKFYEIFSAHSETLFLFILYSIRLIIVVMFLLDVFVFFRLYYFYKSLYLLSISLVIRLVFFLIKDFITNLEEIHKRLKIEVIGNDEITQEPITTYSLQQEYANEDLEYYISQYILCSKLKGYLYIYEKYSDYFGPRINILIYSLYTIGWSYIIFINYQYICTFF